MRYELELLENLIAIELLPINDSTRSVDQEKFKSIQEIVATECERIKAAFVRVAFTYDDDKQVERHFQNHQQALIRLSDQLLSYLSADEVAGLFEIFDKPNIYKIIHSCLENLLSYIEKHFSKYFDLSTKIPESYRQIISNEFSKKLPSIKQQLIDKGINSQKVNEITEIFEKFSNNRDQDTSYKKLIFLKELIKELEELSNSAVERKDLQKMLCSSMIYINYNSFRLFNHCSKEIKESYQSKETLNEQLDKLAVYLKIVNQQQEKPGFSYKQADKSLKVQLLEWITEEIIYLERKQQLTFPFKSQKTGEEGISNKFKIVLESSVPRVAFFVKILMETGLIKNQNVMDVIRFFSSHISTTRVQTISHESFRTKFYNSEDAAKEAVENNVVMLLNHIRKSRK